MATRDIRGVVLMAHGARDPRWAEPLAAIEARIRAQDPSLGTARAYLELMQPDLAGAVDALVREGRTAITVVPVFLGQGGHVRRDLPERVREVAARHPDVRLRLVSAIGEDEHVLDAITACCLRAAHGDGSDAAASGPHP